MAAPPGRRHQAEAIARSLDAAMDAVGELTESETREAMRIVPALDNRHLSHKAMRDAEALITQLNTRARSEHTREDT